MTIPIKEQRELCAKFIGWRWRRLGIYHNEAVYLMSNKVVCLAANYHPDLDDPASREQLEGIKARLRELKTGYVVEWMPLGTMHKATLFPPKSKMIQQSSKVSEGSALVAAVTEMETQKESDNGKTMP